MDIVEALDMLEITKKIPKISQPKIRKKSQENKKKKFVVQKSVIQKLNEEFVQELRNEIQNRPDFSSVNLANFLRASGTRNMLFQENTGNCR